MVNTSIIGAIQAVMVMERILLHHLIVSFLLSVISGGMECDSDGMQEPVHSLVKCTTPQDRLKAYVETIARMKVPHGSEQFTFPEMC